MLKAIERLSFLMRRIRAAKGKVRVSGPDFRSVLQQKGGLDDHRITYRLQGDCSNDPLETAEVRQRAELAAPPPRNQNNSKLLQPKQQTR